MRKESKGLLPDGAAAFFDVDGAQAQLAARLGYPFKDPSLLKTALTHPSMNQKGNNQRLEFLGDAVLQLVISKALYERRGENEGKLTFRRQRLVNEATLAQVARQLDLGKALRLDPAFHKDGGAKMDSVLADAMEAVLGAIYLDGGLEAAGAVILRFWAPLIETADAGLDSRGALQAYLQKAGLPEVEYRELAVKGPPHRRVFTIAVFYKGLEVSRGEGSTKRAAMQQAAAAALSIMRIKEGGHEAEQA